MPVKVVRENVLNKMKCTIYIIYSLVNNAAIMILTTPVYVFNMSAQLKVFLNRLHAVDYRVFKSKK